MLSKIQISELKKIKKQMVQFSKKIEQLGQHAHKIVGLKDGKDISGLVLWDYLYNQTTLENFLNSYKKEKGNQ